MTEKELRVRADFNGLFDDVLCLSHEDTCIEDGGSVVHLREGLVLIAYDEDLDEDGNRDPLIARGIVEPTPEWLKCRGSRWVLKIDMGGVKHESDLRI